MRDLVSQRLTQLQSHLEPYQAVLLSNPNDITYYSHFSYLVPEEREGLLLVTQEQAYLLYASFSPTPNTNRLVFLPGVSPHQLAQHLKTIITNHPITEVLVDKTRLYAEEYEALLQVDNLSFTNLDRSLIWKQRMIKDAQEISAITKAGSIAAQAITAAREKFAKGMTEQAFQQLLESEMTRLGSQKPAFPTIVAFGPHTALPHHQPTDTPLREETAVLIDFGATIDGYRSDMTVSFWFGSHPPEEYLDIQHLVHEADLASLSVLEKKLKSELTAAAVDQAARSLITAASYGSRFIHTTGHGVGLDIHEQPSIHWHNQVLLEPNMVITIEPGIYLPNSYGYRHEHTVLLKESGYQELTLTNHDFNSHSQ
jgi:Xaa-Pro aminopeptidase